MESIQYYAHQFRLMGCFEGNFINNFCFKWDNSMNNLNIALKFRNTLIIYVLCTNHEVIVVENVNSLGYWGV